jgi:energy-coupling factor transporter ATP-binding protein EcfA2
MLSTTRICARFRGKLVPRIARENGFQLSSSDGDFITDVGSLSSAVSALVAAFPGVSKALEKLKLNLPTTTYTFEVPDNYINRPSLESKILKIYNTRKKTDEYTVLVGVKGSGKSSTVAHVLNNKPGLLYITVSESDTSLSLLQKMLSISGERCDENMNILDVNILYPVFKQAAKDMGGRRVTVVLEIERGADSSSVLYMAKSAAKKLAVASNVIIILSEANAGLMFGDDLRQEFIWVDGMTEDEATMYAKKEFPAISDSDLGEFIEKVLLVALS